MTPVEHPMLDDHGASTEQWWARSRGARLSKGLAVVRREEILQQQPQHCPATGHQPGVAEGELHRLASHVHQRPQPQGAAQELRLGEGGDRLGRRGIWVSPGEQEGGGGSVREAGGTGKGEFDTDAADGGGGLAGCELEQMLRAEGREGDQTRESDSRCSIESTCGAHSPSPGLEVDAIGSFSAACGWAVLPDLDGTGPAPLLGEVHMDGAAPVVLQQRDGLPLVRGGAREGHTHRRRLRDV